MGHSKHSKLQTISVLSIIGFSALIIGITVFMTLKNTGDLNAILEESIKHQLISTSIAARGLLDVDKFDSYMSMVDTDNDREAYEAVLRELRFLQKETGAEYIYALKLINDKYYFVFDTDEEDDTRFQEYTDVSEVHKYAFLGEESAGIMNVVDEWGSFNTGAVPIHKDGRIIGIISTDIEDTFIQESHDASYRNAVFLIVMLVITSCAMTLIVALLLRSVKKQNRLFLMANYDALTGLPNRHYLMHYLPEIADMALTKDAPFAFLLIDLDNFKSVNDGEGHDAGDELLRQFAKYLDNVHKNSKIFRPAPGKLNVSARLGGDEFVQIIHDIHTVEEAEQAAEKVLGDFGSQISNRFIKKYHVGMSVGVAIFPTHTENYDVLIKYADVAMYHAKRGGKNTYCIYEEETHSVSDDKPEEQDIPLPNRRQFRDE